MGFICVKLEIMKSHPLPHIKYIYAMARFRNTCSSVQCQQSSALKMDYGTYKHDIKHKINATTCLHGEFQSPSHLIR